MRTLFTDGWSFAKLHCEHVEPGSGQKAVIQEPEDFFGKEPGDFRPVHLPHDWLISDTADLYEDSVGFYRKSFPVQDTGSRLFLRFEGVYMNWCVFVNGKLACKWRYGYTTVEFEITPFVQEGQNDLELIAVHQNPNSRWYSGAGIFRDVYLCRHASVRIRDGGTYFVAAKKEGTEWSVRITTEVDGGREGISVRHELLLPDGSSLPLSEPAESLTEQESLAPAMGTAARRSVDAVHELTAVVRNPPVWSTDEPSCLTLRTTLFQDGTAVDELSQTVGFRTIRFDPAEGFFLNGKQTKLHGVCQHHDLGLLGAAFDVRALRRQFLKLREMGANAIRTSHNPPAPAFMELADRMGFLVVDECFDMWERTKTTYDYANHFPQWHDRDESAWVRRDRNHPCLIMWSVGNEIYDTHFPEGLSIAKDLVAIVRRHDPCKNAAVTIGSNFMPWEGAQNCAAELDAVGYNYLERIYDEHHAAHPEWCIYGSETSSTVQSRGVYHFPFSNRVLTHADHQCSSLGNCTTNWGSKSTAYNITEDRDRAFCAGQFIWTGWDYIGEPTPYHTKNSYFGQIDTAGFEKDTFYQYKAAWVPFAKEPFVHVLPHWSFNEGQLIDVRIYSNAPEVELFLNGRSLGRRKNDVARGKELASTWEGVPYEEGSLEAVAYDRSGAACARDVRHSFSDAVSLVLTPEPYGSDGLHFICIHSVDSDGHEVCDSRSSVTVSVTGGAVLCGLDNGDSTDFGQYQGGEGKPHTRRLFSNRLLAMVRETEPHAEFSVTAESPSLSGAVLTFKDGKCVSSSGTAVPSCGQDSQIPVRSITLVCKESRRLTPSHKEVLVKAVVHPADATDRTLSWAPMMLEGVASDCAVLSVRATPDGGEAVVTARSDGSFRLTCSASNGGPWPQVLSELEFDVSGLGSANRNPYALIEACKCSRSLHPVRLSFDGGVFTPGERSWYLFDNVDFGTQGSDSISVPVFHWDPDADFELWEGNPDEGGTKIMDCHYHAPSVYNTYTACTFTLPRRLFGVHDISIVCSMSISIQGFRFEESPKAFAWLRALDSSSLVGDTFTRTADAVEGIGNNVALSFADMDFGGSAARQITICGRAPVDNTIHVRFSGQNGDANRIVEFKRNGGYEERTFSLDGLAGQNTVTFVFLPGSNFDFKWFRFS